MTLAPKPADPTTDVERLRRRLDRERARRKAAEEIGERLTTDLRRAQKELLARAERAEKLVSIARRLRSELAVDELMLATTQEAGGLLDVERCQLHSTSGAVVAAWCRSGDTDPALPFSALPPAVTVRFAGSLAAQRTIGVDDVRAEGGPDRASGGGSVGALLAVPVRAEDHSGWLLLLDTSPRSWTDNERKLAETLAAEHAARLLELDAAERREETRRSEELNAAEGELVATVSHELRTPLTSIQGYTELMADGSLGELNPALSSAVRVIEQNADRLAQLAENLLMVSRDEEGGRLELEPLHLGRVAIDCERAMRTAARGTGVTIDTTVEPGLHRILGDLRQLERVVLNLLSNALKFSSENDSVSVRVGNAEDGVVLEVADTGIGIPAGELTSVFSRFFRSSLSVSREIPGTGLGLAVSKSIVHHHGGQLSLESTEGVGTTVRVELPVHPPEPDLDED